MSAIKKYLLRPDRLRQVPPSFSWIDHRLIRDDHLLRLQPPEILLYFFLLLVGDHRGLSYYSLRSITRYLKLPPEETKLARASLCDRSLIAYKRPLYQVLSLPEKTELLPQSPLTSRGGETTSLGEVLDKILRHKNGRR